MCNSLIPKTLRGGGRTLSHPTIDRRVLSYIEKKLHTSLARLDPVNRQHIIAVLVDKFGYTPAELMRLFERSRAQTYRDIDIAFFRQKRLKSAQKAFTEILDYILYNAKYIP